MQTFKLGAILLSLLGGILLGQASNFVPPVDANHKAGSAGSAAVLAVNLSPLAALDAPALDEPLEADLACLECLNEPVGMNLDLSALNALEPLDPIPDPISKGAGKPVDEPAVVKPVPVAVPPAPAVQPVKPVKPVQPVIQTQACPGGQCYQVTPQVISQPAPRRGLGKLIFRK